MFLKIIENITCGYVLSKFGLIISNIIYNSLNKLILSLGCFYVSYKLFIFAFEFNEYIKNKYTGNERTETYILIFSTLFGFTVGLFY